MVNYLQDKVFNLHSDDLMRNYYLDFDMLNAANGMENKMRLFGRAVISENNTQAGELFDPKKYSDSRGRENVNFLIFIAESVLFSEELFLKASMTSVFQVVGIFKNYLILASFVIYGAMFLIIVV